MSRSACSFVAISLGLWSCTKQPAPTPQAPRTALARLAVYTLRCQLTYYPLGAQTESDPPQRPMQKTLTVQGDAQGEITLAGLRLYAHYAIGQAHHSGVKLELTSDGAPLVGHLYQLPDAMPPADLGGGFTGIVSAHRPGHSGDYEYSCELLPTR